MGVYVYIGRDGANSAELRAGATRQRHLDNLEGLEQAGRILFAGPLKEEGGAACGSVIVLEADNLEEAREIAHSDPYLKEGVFDRVDVYESLKVFPKT